jgi:secreted PhoX family phosphatase
MKTSRRRFLAGGAVTAATLGALGAHRALAAAGTPAKRRSAAYGGIRPLADRDGRTILALPEGFEYATFSRTGEPYESGIVPRSHDGMTCIAGSGGLLRLIRNHELRNTAGDRRLGVDVPAHLRYDAQGMGGCFALDFDPQSKRLVHQFAVLGGTIVNCSGGLSRDGRGWFSCEEVPAGVQQGFDAPHGYVFHVPSDATEAVRAVPLKAMGRFAHEAAVASASGLVYETEDAGNTSGFYRYTPHAPDDPASGRLEMLALEDTPHADLFGPHRSGVRLRAAWVAIADPDPDLERGAPTCFAQGRARGAAAFNRLEGIFRSPDAESIYFTSTSGGADRASDGVGYGRLWHYVPAGAAQSHDTLELVFESGAPSVLESPDNLCITPRGGILFCEDDAIANGDTSPLTGTRAEINRLIGLSPEGEAFTFAVNLLNRTEFAGACWSPDGEILFVNIYGDSRAESGMTCAIWGPWKDGPL